MQKFVELLRTEWPLKPDQRMRAVFFLRELSNTQANKMDECGKSRSINNQMDVPTNSGQAHLLFVTIHPPSIEQSSHFFAFLSKTIYRTVWSAVATFSSVWFHWISLAWTLNEHHLQNLTFFNKLKSTDAPWTWPLAGNSIVLQRRNTHYHQFSTFPGLHNKVVHQIKILIMDCHNPMLWILRGFHHWAIKTDRRYLNYLPSFYEERVQDACFGPFRKNKNF